MCPILILMTVLNTRRTTQAVAIAAMGLGLATVVPTVAGATYPGGNGDIAFVTTRGSNVNILQVNPNAPNIGTSAGDLAATTPLTAGATDAEPFYSPDGTQVVFSSNRNGRFGIFTVAQSDTNEATPAVEISQTTPESHDDYGPSFSPDGSVVVFNRDNLAITSVVASVGPSSACTLYTPAGGLALGGTNGDASRVVFDPVDATKLVYVSGTNQIHLLNGFVQPTAATPCPSEAGVTDVNLSTTATGSALGSAADENPDWAPDGSKIVFDSTRSGGHSLWYFTNPTSATPTVAALWPGQAGSGGTTDTQPVFSPDGLHIAYTQPVTQNGQQVIDYESNTFGAPLSSATDLTLGVGKSANSQPAWQPLQPGPSTPEAPSALLLPGVALLAGGGFLLVRSRRRTA